MLANADSGRRNQLTLKDGGYVGMLRISLLLLGFTSAHVLAAQAGTGQGGVGESAPAKMVVLGDLPPATAEELALHPPIPRPQSGLTDRDWAERMCLGRQFAAGRVPRRATVPGEPIAAKAPTQVLKITDTAVSIMASDGALLPGYPKSLRAFLGTSADTFLFQATTAYDAFYSRFVAVVEEFDPSIRSWRTYVVMSETEDATGAWKLIRMQEACVLQ
jgi:hypothetical protein